MEQTAATGRTGASHDSTPAPRAEDDLLRTRLIRARFEALAEWGVPLEDAGTIAQDVDVDIISVFELLQHGCPSDLVLSIMT